MDQDTAMRQITFARKTPFRDVFKPYVGKYPHTLGEESIALVFHVSIERVTANDKIMDTLESVVPGECCDHFKILQEMKTERGLFFTRFVLFTKNPIDGVLVGFGTDEMYYVVVVWDGAGYDLWKPDHDLYDRSVLVDGEMKTVVCLSHHQEVTVKLISFGDGHIALCPKCNRLAYSGD